VKSKVYKSSIEEDLISKIEPVLEGLGYECRDVEIVPGGEAVIRITLDRPAGQTETPIGIDDCSNVHRLLNPMFDVWDPLPGAYTLELSSPGEKPRLRTLEHFRQVLGEKIKFQTQEPLPMPPPAKPRKNWEGVLESLIETEGSEKLRLKDGLGTFEVPLKQVKNALWLREWDV
jgi:ribosome maturation factor RimP